MFRLSLALVACAAHSLDDIALIQHAHVELDTSSAADFAKVMHSDDAKAAVDMAAQLSDSMESKVPHQMLTNLLKDGKAVDEAARSTLTRGWAHLEDTFKSFKGQTPKDLLKEAQVALVQTGAMEQMRQMALARANATKTISQGAVPLDSMMVGFRTSVAPWNNLLRMLGMPLVKASFTIFTNFFGPYGTGARLCIGAQVAADSTYGVHTRSEFGGINVWIGPAKWDNVPGWSFGTSGGVDNVPVWDVSDFAWTWTLAKEPETVGFHWDVLLIDDETLHAGMLQTASEVESETIPRHGSTWLQHIWCSPHWINTPLVIEDDQPAVPKSKPEAAKVQKSESWEPETEAV